MDCKFRNKLSDRALARRFVNLESLLNGYRNFRQSRTLE